MGLENAGLLTADVAGSTGPILGQTSLSRSFASYGYKIL